LLITQNIFAIFGAVGKHFDSAIRHPCAAKESLGVLTLVCAPYAASGKGKSD
jgi:hypothetical protein